MSGNFEGKKHAYRQTQDGIVVSFVVHPSDISSAIAMAPLGTRFMVAFAEIGDDENPTENDESRRVNDEIRSVTLPPLSTVPRPQANEAGISKPKQRFADLPLSQQAGIRCADPAFTKFLQETGLHDCTRDTDDVVRHLCGVKSRTELTANDKAARLWHKLNVEYEEWLTDKQYAESIRR